ncbi:MAG: helix-hairpin-helix domain-containing protein [Candidatus Hodarchaeota archaeon]
MTEYKRDSLVVRKTQLSTLRGIGPITAEKLVKAGYDDIEALAKARPERLQKISGIGAKTAIVLVSEANYYLGANEKTIIEPVKEERIIEPVKEERIIEPVKEERKEMEEEKVTTFREALLMAKRREMTQFKSQVRNLQAKLVLGEISRDRYYSQRQDYDDEIKYLEEEINSPPTVNPAVTKRMTSSIIKQKIISLEKQLLQKTISPSRFFELRDKYERELRAL